ncbi:major histocompatibility complex class I-related gene protein-like isoform X3 [Alosa alosa]|uniref:major histocompatibility complex class I-related gene protein-like isoform X3 n=1 Tax=Alosa alosa TaxID=278164 RepID=UPI0020154C08|nr:major histocompatibility complex class I-related gene protein-like isoform X3 [Alosa alosa]
MQKLIFLFCLFDMSCSNRMGIDIFQRATGCELLNNDRPGPMFTKDAYNGESVVIDHYDADHDALRIEWRWPDIEDKPWTQRMNFPLHYRMIYHPLCIKYLRKHLVKERNRVLKKVKPRVRLLQKTLPDSGGPKVTCLATGFYPRHINLTLLREGQSVSDHQITGGELLPNGDETYQMRKSLEVSAEELQHHHYTCTAEHLSLDNKLEISLAGISE